MRLIIRSIFVRCNNFFTLNYVVSYYLSVMVRILNGDIVPDDNPNSQGNTTRNDIYSHRQVWTFELLFSFHLPFD